MLENKSRTICCDRRVRRVRYADRPHVATRNLRSNRRQNFARGFQMRKVDHLAVHAQRAGARIRVERGDDLARMRDLDFGWRITSVDCGDLIGMDREAPDETVAPGASTIPLEALRIAKIRVNRIDGHDFG